MNIDSQAAAVAGFAIGLIIMAVIWAIAGRGKKEIKTIAPLEDTMEQMALRQISREVDENIGDKEPRTRLARVKEIVRAYESFKGLPL